MVFDIVCPQLEGYDQLLPPKNSQSNLHVADFICHLESELQMKLLSPSLYFTLGMYLIGMLAYCKENFIYIFTLLI